MAPLPQKAIIKFDGECGLCQRAIRFVVQRDHGQHFEIQTLQSEPGCQACHPDSIIVQTPDGYRLERSDAVLYTLSRLRTFWRILLPLRCLPRTWRDGLYNLVARHRFKFFGRLPL